MARSLGLVYGGFSYTRETHETKLGLIEFAVEARGTVRIPVRAGVGAIAVGTLVLVVGGDSARRPPSRSGLPAFSTEPG